MEGGAEKRWAHMERQRSGIWLRYIGTWRLVDGCSAGYVMFGRGAASRFRVAKPAGAVLWVCSQPGDIVADGGARKLSQAVVRRAGKLLLSESGQIEFGRQAHMLLE